MNAPSSPSRTVHCAEALGWLREQPLLAGCSLITSLPDSSEVGMSPERWRGWFQEAAQAVLSRTPDDGVAIFFQTDVKKGGVWIDKGAIVQRAAEAAGVTQLWHKIVCRVPPGTISWGRAGFSHLLCYSRGLRPDPAQSGPDVFAELGEMTWTRAIGLVPCAFACRYVLRETATRTVVDPFCGVGTILAVANALGLDAVGVELNRKRAAESRQLVIESSALTTSSRTGA